MVCLKLITSGLMGNFHLIDLYPQASVYLFLGTFRMFGLNTTESPLLFNSSQKHSIAKVVHLWKAFLKIHSEVTGTKG